MVPQLAITRPSTVVPCPRAAPARCGLGEPVAHVAVVSPAAAPDRGSQGGATENQGHQAFASFPELFVSSVFHFTSSFRFVSLVSRFQRYSFHKFRFQSFCCIVLLLFAYVSYTYIAISPILFHFVNRFVFMLRRFVCSLEFRFSFLVSLPKV